MNQLRCGDRNFNARRLYVMGVINVTPDSFSDGGFIRNVQHAVDYAQDLLEYGADVLDIGGVATSPHIDPSIIVPEDKEMQRVIPVIEALTKRGIRNLSVDTSRARVAHAALDAGASWINDQWAGLFDPGMPEAMARADGVVVMHKKGMHTGVFAGAALSYDDIIEDLLSFFRVRVSALVDSGVVRSRIIVDPGLGFGKGLADSLTIINNLHRFNEFDLRNLIGISRKSFLIPMTGIKNAVERDFASLGAQAAAILSGADFIRTHNVRATVEMAKVFTQCLGRT